MLSNVSEVCGQPEDPMNLSLCLGGCNRLLTREQHNSPLHQCKQREIQRKAALGIQTVAVPVEQVRAEQAGREQARVRRAQVHRETVSDMTLMSDGEGVLLKPGEVEAAGLTARPEEGRGHNHTGVPVSGLGKVFQHVMLKSIEPGLILHLEDNPPVIIHLQVHPDSADNFWNWLAEKSIYGRPTSFRPLNIGARGGTTEPGPLSMWVKFVPPQNSEVLHQINKEKVVDGVRVKAIKPVKYKGLDMLHYADLRFCLQLICGYGFPPTLWAGQTEAERQERLRKVGFPL